MVNLPLKDRPVTSLGLRLLERRTRLRAHVLRPDRRSCPDWLKSFPVSAPCTPVVYGLDGTFIIRITHKHGFEESKARATARVGI